MPLIKSPSEKAFTRNVATEMDAGKPQNQSLAIAYAMKKKAKKMACGGKMMADGGMMEPEADPSSFEGYDKTKAKKVSDSFMGSEGYAEGGFVDEEKASGYEPDPMENPEHMVEHEVPNQDHDMTALEMIDAIMQKRSMAKGYSMGGKVSNDVGEGQDVDRMPNQFDDVVLDSDSMDGADYTGANSGDEIGDEGEDERRRDIVSFIMKSRAKKDRLPNPR